jgi:hypothetical protein
MKTFICAFFITFSFSCSAQDSLRDEMNTEFVLHENGLIYDETTMKKLSSIVDSLNIRFIGCEPKTYQSFAQGYARYIRFSRNAKNIREAIRNDMPLEAFMKKFPQVKTDKPVWVMRFSYKRYDGDDIIKYATLPLRNQEEIELYLEDKPGNNKTHGWVYDEDAEGFSAFYLEDLRAVPLADEYARLVQYVDCMVDTTAEIYYPRIPEDDDESVRAGSKVASFLACANDFEGEPEYPQIEWDSPFANDLVYKYQREHLQWNNKRIDALDKKINEGQYYRSLLMDAANEALAEGHSNEDLEFYVERYLSAAQALELKRHRKVVGLCSMDSRPREHASNICRLAAKSAQWDIFLRAHLDIMNDNFDRNTDGSYAWAARGTYLKELEVLDIHATDLLIGTSLRSDNTSRHHYFGNIGRIGRALSETSDLEGVEKRILKMIADEKLDLFNRLLMVYLFDHYNLNLKDKVRKKINIEKYNNAIATLPKDVVDGLHEE